ncbi:hypothetical protein [Brevundimonas sp. KM4]|uniref:hypothetical protein n=1 Tax=Brevundimonas sp. KM4 TaxID=1628191 RepID=UPI000AF16ABD|nr:hypothetical protein [Brevundimonas sp. KM4]
MRNLVISFVRRIRQGDLKNALYLTYYYAYLMTYDVIHGTRFAVSHKPGDMGNEALSGSTGNFPAHPRLIRRYLQHANIDERAPVIDIGHGSGTFLHVASLEGYTNLSGIEFGHIPFAMSQRNLGERATLIHGDALALDLTPYRALFFFNPFRGDLAVTFFNRLPDNVLVVVSVNHDPVIESILHLKGFSLDFLYSHPIYSNFNCKIWKRRPRHA